MSLFFVNDLADPARDSFLTSCLRRMPFYQIVNVVRRHFNSDTRKQQLQFEIDSLFFFPFIRKHSITDPSVGLTRIMNHINALAPQLSAGLGDDNHKSRYLRRAVMGLDWAQQPIAQIASSRYTFIQLLTALQESLQLQEDLSHAAASNASTIHVPFHTQAMIEEIILVGGTRNYQDIRFREPNDHAHHVRRITDDPVEIVRNLATAKIVADGIQVYAIRDSVEYAGHLTRFSATLSAHHHWDQSKRTL